MTDTTTTDTTDTTRREVVARIARKTLGLETLEDRGNDSLDFHEHGVLQVRDALELAYDAGTQARKSTQWTSLGRTFHAYYRTSRDDHGHERSSIFLGRKTREDAYRKRDELIHEKAAKWATVAELVEWAGAGGLTNGDVVAVFTMQGHELYAFWNGTTGKLVPFNPYDDEGGHVEAFVTELERVQGLPL